MDEERYEELQAKKHQEHEALCKRCGACCGVIDGDPCEHLSKTPENIYVCDIYENRFGMRKTIKGEPILCVPIRNILNKSWWGRIQCAYVKRLT